MDLVLTWPLFNSIAALVVSVIAVGVSILYNRRALRQAEAHATTQLTYQDRIRVLRILFDVAHRSIYAEKFVSDMNELLVTTDAIFIPKALRARLYQLVDRVKQGKNPELEKISAVLEIESIIEREIHTPITSWKEKKNKKSWR